MSKAAGTRLLEERVIEVGVAGEAIHNRAARLRRSVTVNLAESPLGWLRARGLVSRRQFDAGERLRADWERAQLPPRVTMSWDSAPVASARGGSSPGPDLCASQLDARRRFDAALDEQGRASQTYCGAWFAPAKACARLKPRLAGLPAPESWF